MRPDWDEYFFKIIDVVKGRSTCLRREIGAIIVKDNHILSTGYNGVPTGISHCTDVGCLRAKLNVPSGQRHELCRGLHAEQNAIIQAAKYGIKVEGAKIYTNVKPCSICTKMIINSGIKEIVFIEYYNDPLADELLSETDLIVRKFESKG
ncbi:MAG: cytidine/deoxycytidylate deaminase family protein [Calditerrivibrio sp.]|nr:cytidine/deoxycytidylate deaminase family protein [Calditerrivibrio sp.]MCA1932261.1 cytidine/deoxycytidylate deaminase family protein [Calditerrivibrio sp.]